jgi:ubiquinone biosynthesis protein UbiJ
MIKQSAAHWLSAAINRVLALDPEALAKLSPMQGRVIGIELTGLDQRFYVLPTDRGIEITTQYDDVPDTMLRGTPLALFKMGMRGDIAPLLLQGEISIEGDTQLGREFKKWLASIAIDWEEYLARAIGDAPAHTLFNGLHKLNRWLQTSGAAVMADTGEYLQEESRDVVPAAELDAFYREVDALRDASARLEAQIKTLRRNRQSKT